MGNTGYGGGPWDTSGYCLCPGLQHSGLDSGIHHRTKGY